MCVLVHLYLQNGWNDFHQTWYYYSRVIGGDFGKANTPKNCPDFESV